MLSALSSEENQIVLFCEQLWHIMRQACYRLALRGPFKNGASILAASGRNIPQSKVRIYDKTNHSLLSSLRRS